MHLCQELLDRLTSSEILGLGAEREGFLGPPFMSGEKRLRL